MLLAPEETVVLLIDPQVGFCSASGTLARIYGLDDLLPAIETMDRIVEFLGSIPKSVSVVVVTSEYPPGLHTNGDLKSDLSYLCTAGSEDAQLAGGLTLQPNWTYVTKPDINAMESPYLRSFLFRTVPRPFRSILVAGFTATTCVLRTTLEAIQYSAPMEISLAVVRDLVGARHSTLEPTSGRPTRVDDAFERMETAGAFILPSWQSIEWRPKCTS